MVDDADRGRLPTGNFESDAINPPDETSSQSAVTGRYFHLGQSLIRGVQDSGIPGIFGKYDDFEPMVKKSPALAYAAP